MRKRSYFASPRLKVSRTSISLPLYLKISSKSHPDRLVVRRAILDEVYARQPEAVLALPLLFCTKSGKLFSMFLFSMFVALSSLFQLGLFYHCLAVRVMSHFNAPLRHSSGSARHSRIGGLHFATTHADTSASF